MGNCINRFYPILCTVYLLEYSLQVTSRGNFQLKYFGIAIRGVNECQKWYGLYSAKIVETLLGDCNTNIQECLSY